MLGDVSIRALRASSTTLVSLHARRQVGKLIRTCIVLPRGVDDLVVLVDGKIVNLDQVRLVYFTNFGAFKQGFFFPAQGG